MKKYALLAGTGDYDLPTISPLQYAVRDVEEIGKVLDQHCGFNTMVLKNPSDSQLIHGLNSIQAKVEPDDLFLFFFAGHGLEEEKEGYLLLKNAMPEGSIKLGMIRLKDLQKQLMAIESRKRLLFLDCCRNDPEKARGESDNLMGEYISRDISLFAARNDAPGQVTMLLQACKRGQRAYEIDEERHGVFSWYLKQGLLDGAWQNSALKATELCRYVQNGVMRWSSRKGLKQTPDFQHLETADDILLAGEEKVEPSPAPTPTPAPVELVRCPLCGRKNHPAETFYCSGCGKEDFCLGHQDEQSFLCVTCEQKRVAEENKVENRLEPPAAEEPVVRVVQKPVENSESGVGELKVNEARRAEKQKIVVNLSVNYFKVFFTVVGVVIFFLLTAMACINWNLHAYQFSLLVGTCSLLPGLLSSKGVVSLCKHAIVLSYEAGVMKVSSPSGNKDVVLQKVTSVKMKWRGETYEITYRLGNNVNECLMIDSSLLGVRKSTNEDAQKILQFIKNAAPHITIK